MSIYSDWRMADARQARADLLAREKLLESVEMPQCQQLHFLQMACEKVCKAFLCGQGVDPNVLRKSHAFIAGPLPVIARQFFARRSKGASRERSWILSAIAALARKIELLAPAVDDSGRHPVNCEYPWTSPDGAILAPAEHNFAIDLLYEPAGRQLLTVLYAAVDELMLPDTPL